MDTNPVEPTGRQVETVEVMACAKPNCTHCYGSAVITRIVGEARIPTLCACAKRRFMKRYGKETAFDAKGAMYWLETPPAPAPEESRIILP